MSSLKSQWETGSVTATKEERMEEKKEELNKLRQRICLGRSESMKAVYEKACQDTTKGVAERPEVDVGRDIKATRLKEKFEKGELVSEVEEENLEKVRKEKEEDLSVFSEPGIIFLNICILNYFCKCFMPLYISYNLKNSLSYMFSLSFYRYGK